MALTKTDKKDIALMMGEAITDLILPQIDEIKSDIKDIKKDVAILKEDVHDLQLTTHRIETRQIAEVERVDNHEVRIGKLEKAVSR